MLYSCLRYLVWFFLNIYRTVLLLTFAFYFCCAGGHCLLGGRHVERPYITSRGQKSDFPRIIVQRWFGVGARSCIVRRVGCRLAVSRTLGRKLGLGKRKQLRRYRRLVLLLLLLLPFFGWRRRRREQAKQRRSRMCWATFAVHPVRPLGFRVARRPGALFAGSLRARQGGGDQHQQ